MSQSHPRRAAGAHSLTIKVGKLFEASATGWGVVGAVLALLLVVAAAALWAFAGTAVAG